MNDSILEQKAVEAIKTCFDPEIPVNIYDLGLIYKVEETEAGKIKVEMTLTSPSCPVAESLPMEVQEKVAKVEGVEEVDLQVVWDPPWSMDMMTDEARFALDMF